MASVKEIAQKEYKLYTGIASMLKSIKEQHPMLINNVEKQMLKIASNQREISNFINSPEGLSEKSLQEKWADIKANTKMHLTPEERKDMKKFFQEVGDSFAKTEAFKNLYQIYLESRVSEKGLQTASWQKEKEKLEIRKNALNEKTRKYENFENEYQDTKFGVEFSARVLEGRRKEESPYYAECVERFEEKYMNQNKVPILDEKYLEDQLINIGYKQKMYKENLEKLEKNPSAKEEEILLLKNTIQKIDKQFDEKSELLNDLQVLRKARESADRLPRVSDYKKAYDQQVAKFAPLEELKKEYDDIKKESAQLEAKIDADVIVEDIKNDIKMFIEECDMRKGNHKNSVEFDRMIAAMYKVGYWNDPNAPEECKKGDNTPATLNEALKELQDATQNYLDAKNKQFRLFPTPLRQSRFGFATALKEKAETHMEKLNLPEKGLVIENKLAKEEVTKNL